MNKLISVIIPVYNVDKYLSQCIESVLRQTFLNLEILLIDDGSTDGSGNICDQYAMKDNRIQVVHKINGGVSSARNVGLELANGEFIAFIDGDDFVSENYIESLYRNLKENNSDMAFCEYAYYKNGFVKFAQNISLEKIRVDKQSKEFISFFKRFISNKNTLMGRCWGGLYKKEIISSIRFNSEIKIAEDLLFVLQAILNAEFLSFISEKLYFYRVNNQSALRTYKKSYLQNQVLLYDNIRQIYNFMSDIKLLKIYGCRLCYDCLVNEIKFKKENRREQLEEIRKSKLYQYFTLKNIFKQGNVKAVAKVLVRWFLIKTRLV